MPSCLNHIDVMQGLNRCTRCGKTFCGDCLVELKGGFFCAPCKSEQVKDIQSGVDATQLPLAGTGARFAAQFIDGIVMRVVTIPLNFIFTTGAIQPGSTNQAMSMLVVVLLIQFGLWYLYEALMLQWRGQTLGKMALKIKVVTPEGNDIAASQAWIRPLIRILMTVTIIVDYIPAFFTKGKTCIHDMVAKTRVVKLQA